MRKITGIIIHTTATRPEWWADRSTSDKVDEVRRWHVEGNGWRDIGYHYLIDRDGTLATGRPLEQDGAHVRGHNTGTVGISLFGGHGSAETDKFSDHYTDAQEVTLRKLLAELHKRFGSVPIAGHNEFAAKACPGFNVPAWLESNDDPAPEADEATLYRWRLSAIRDYADEALRTKGRME